MEAADVVRKGDAFAWDLKMIGGLGRGNGKRLGDGGEDDGSRSRGGVDGGGADGAVGRGRGGFGPRRRG